MLEMSPEDLMMHLPHMVKNAARNTLPPIDSSDQDAIEVEVVLRLKFVRKRFTAGRAKGNQAWEAEGAEIVSAAGKEPVFTDVRGNCTGAWLNNPKA
jgi:hypothetical protein